MNVNERQSSLFFEKETEILLDNYLKSLATPAKSVRCSVFYSRHKTLHMPVLCLSDVIVSATFAPD
jgi:hypothetical protein